jgi:hypothetical protein
MSIENPKIRRRNFLLVERRKVAAAFNEKLSEGLSVFFFPRTQEELAGTDL